MGVKGTLGAAGRATGVNDERFVRVRAAWLVCAPRCSARKTGGWSTRTSRFGNSFPIHNAEGNVRAMLDHDLGAYFDVLLAAQQAAGCSCPGDSEVRARPTVESIMVPPLDHSITVSQIHTEVHALSPRRRASTSASTTLSG